MIWLLLAVYVFGVLFVYGIALTINELPKWVLFLGPIIWPILVVPIALGKKLGKEV